MKMINSKAIKLLITKNQSHDQSKLHRQTMSTSQTKHNNLSGISMSTNPIVLTDMSSQVENIVPTSSLSSQYLEMTLSLSDMDKYSYSMEMINSNAKSYTNQRSMFTIREEQSYQYESDFDSICCQKKALMSIIQQLSTIKLETCKKQKQNYNTSNKNTKLSNYLSADSENQQCKDPKIQSFDPYQRDKSEHVTMNSSINTNIIAFNSKNALQERMSQTPQIYIQGWDQKYNRSQSFSSKQYQQQQQQVQEQKMIVLKQSQSSLNLQKDKIRNSSIILKPYQKIKKNIDIVYSCSEKQLEEIVRILQKQGIKLRKPTQKSCKKRVLVQISKTGNKNDHKLVQNCQERITDKEKQKKKTKIKLVRHNKSKNDAQNQGTSRLR